MFYELMPRTDVNVTQASKRIVCNTMFKVRL